MQALPVAQNQFVHGVIRATQGKGVMPNQTSRCGIDGKPVDRAMGAASFTNLIAVPEIALAKLRHHAPFDRVLLHRVRCCRRCRRSAVHGRGGGRRTGVIIALGGIGLNDPRRLRMAGAGRVAGVDINPARKNMQNAFGLTRFVNPKDYESPLDHLQAA